MQFKQEACVQSAAVSIHWLTHLTHKNTMGQRNIKITLLQIILYPVALFQQKIVITNKILHLSPRRYFIHFSLRYATFIFLHNLYNLIQFNKGLWITAIKQQDPPNDRRDKGNTDWNRLYRDVTPPPASFQPMATASQRHRGASREL